MQTLKSDYDTCDILLVDNDIDKHFLLKPSVMSSLGSNHKLLIFEAGAKAIQYLNSISRFDFPSLIVLDYDMPLMTGKELLQYLRSTYRYSWIPVIVHSTEMNENMKSDLMDMGAVACFRKTFDVKELTFYLAALAIIFDNKVCSTFNQNLHLTRKNRVNKFYK